MPSELTTIISIVVPIIVVQLLTAFILVRRLDRFYENLSQGRRETERCLTQNMRKIEQRIVQRMDCRRASEAGTSMGEIMPSSTHEEVGR